jgi:hypothetical protein
LGARHWLQPPDEFLHLKCGRIDLQLGDEEIVLALLRQQGGFPAQGQHIPLAGKKQQMGYLGSGRLGRAGRSSGSRGILGIRAPGQLQLLGQYSD